MLELHVADRDVTSGSVAVSWCIDKETLTNLAELGYNHPMVVLITAPIPSKSHRYRVSDQVRKTVPLKDLIAYVEFRASGPNKIWAFLVKDREVAQRAVRNNNLLSEIYDHANQDEDYFGAIDLELYTAHNQPNMIMSEQRDNYEYRCVAEPILVDVPAGAFAKDPPQWEQAWVNMFYRKAPIDQCDYRRRRILAYTLQPLLMLLSLGVRLVVFIIGLLIGARNLHPKYFNFFQYNVESIDEMVKGGTIFYGRTDSVLLNIVRFPLMPLFWPIYYIILMQNSILGLLSTVGTVILSLLIFTVGAGTIGYFYDRHQENVASQPAWYLDEDEQDLIVCTGQKKPMTVGELPLRHRSIRLRVAALKSKVCRPFST